MDPSDVALLLLLFLLLILILTYTFSQTFHLQQIGEEVCSKEKVKDKPKEYEQEQV